jgi:hypothetical protein
MSTLAGKCWVFLKAISWLFHKYFHKYYFMKYYVHKLDSRLPIFFATIFNNAFTKSDHWPMITTETTFIFSSCSPKHHIFRMSESGFKTCLSFFNHYIIVLDILCLFHRNLRTKRRMHLCIQDDQIGRKFMGLAPADMASLPHLRNK